MSAALINSKQELKIDHKTTTTDRINMVVGFLMEAHNLLAKSKLNADQYTPISYRLNQAKILLSEITGKLK